MPSLRLSSNAYHFGPFRLNVQDRLLERNGERVQLTPKAIDTLFVLLENAGQVVSKETLIKAVWPDVTVVESGLTRNISALRKVLEDGREEGSFIETIPRRGYRFVADVREETLASIPVNVPEGAPAASRRPFLLWIGLCLAITAAVIGPVVFFNSGLGKGKAIEPSVRIGEHLLYKLAPEETIRASEHFEGAIAANPRSAAAHAGLSISLLHLAMLGVRPLSEVLPRAQKAAHTSLQLDADSATAHYARGIVLMVRDWDFPQADAAFRRALKLQPDSLLTRLGYSRLKLTLREMSSARQLVEEALRLDPASPPLGTEYCRVFYFMRDFGRAESECRKVLDREPGYALAHYYLALSLGSLGRIAEARQSLDRSALMPGVVEADHAWLSLRAGDRRPALAVLEKRRSLIMQGKLDASAKLLLATVLDRTDEAYEAVEAGIVARAPELLTLDLEPRLDPMRADPRYPAVLRRIGIPAR